MQSEKNSRRAGLAVLLLLIGAAVVSCAHDGLTWQEASSASGNYVIDFPEQPSTETTKIPNTDLSMQLTQAEADTGYYALAETDLNGITPNPLDVAVDASIEGARARMAAKGSSTVTATEISRTTGDFEGVETRQYRVTLAGGGGNYVINGLLFYRDDEIVNAIVVNNSDSDPALAEHFLSSLKSKPEPDRRALPQRFLEVGDQVVGVLDA